MSDVWLAVIAISVALMATVQVAVLVAAARLARRVEQDLKPLLANLTDATAELARTANLAAAQVERVDRLFAEVAQRADQTLSLASTFVGAPAREGMAVVAGMRAAFSAFRGLRESTRRRRATVRPILEDEESLFIG